MRTRILVCDDQPQGLSQIKSALGQGDQIVELVGDKLKTQIKTLFEGISKLLAADGHDWGKQNPATNTVFDEDIEVAIVDNNLSALPLVGQRLTAEAVIGYLRSFTDIPYIVSLNKNPDVDFDLRHMVGDHQTHADLALNASHLPCDALWQNRSGEGDIGRDVFAPSYWPNLHEVAAPRRKLIATMEKRLNKPILQVLGFSDHSIEALSRHAKGALSPEATTDEDLREVTCVDFFRASCRSLPPGERDVLAGRADAGSPYARAVARSVAADLEKWVRRDALVPQDVLIDLPHLLARMPFLLGKDARDVQKWNSALYSVGTSESVLAFVADATIRERVKRAMFSTCGMYMRWPWFWWRDLKDDERLNELFFNCGDPWADAVFCEDTSQFVCLSASDEEDADDPKEFEGDFGGAWSRRYVKELPSKQYSPRSRLAV